jgi:WXXGXW repeat (2 copies)
MSQTSKSLTLASACALALGLTVIATPNYAVAQISVSINLAPPALPVYEQPVLSEEGGIWAPGYWDYNQDGYFWVPGTWVQPPEIGLLWTPGYWAWGNGGYEWNGGYWGATVGFYGGINYGFGYSGRGYSGGHWQGQQFYYNTAVSHVNGTNIRHTYSQKMVNNTTVNRVSYNGGTAGARAQPTATEQAAARAPHQPATSVQMQHRQAAMTNHASSASVNHGRPEIAATSKPAEFKGGNEDTARAAGSRAQAAERITETPAKKPTPVHAEDLPAVVHHATPSTGDVARDQANQRKQDELRDGQEKQRQQLQQKQAADHAQAAKQPSTSGNAQELERQHQAQTQALAQRHSMEQKSLQETQEKKPEAKREAPHTGY